MTTPPPSDGSESVPPPPPAPISGYDPYAPPPQPYAGIPPYPQPYPQPYPGAQNPWAPPPAAQRPRTGVVIGAVVAGVVVMGALLTAGVDMALNAKGPESASGDTPTAPDTAGTDAQDGYPLPETLVDGRYYRSRDISDSVQQQFGPDGADVTGTGGEYNPTASNFDAPSDTLTYWGISGPIGDPALFRGTLFANPKVLGGQGAVGPEDLTPAGTHFTVSCEVVRETENGTDTSLPVCVWDDTNGAIVVSHVTPAIARQNPASVNLQSVADLTGKVVEEVQGPAQ